MLRRATYTVFVKDATGVEVREQLPIHRSGAAIFICNYSSSNRRVLVEISGDGQTWKNVGIITRGGTVNASGVLVKPRGIVVGSFYLPTDNQNLDAKFLRLKLDDTADGDGVFVQVETAAPVPDHPLL
jgi:hypothetical protein